MSNKWLLVKTAVPFGGNRTGHIVVEGIGLDANHLESHRTQISWGFKDGKLEEAKANILATSVVNRDIFLVNDLGKTAFLLPAGEGAHAVVSYVFTGQDFNTLLGWSISTPTTEEVEGMVKLPVTAIQGYNNVHEEVIVGMPMPWISNEIPKGFLPYTGISFDVEAFPKLAKLYPNGILTNLAGDFLRAAEVGRNVWSKQSQSVQALGFRGNALPGHSHPYTVVSGTTRFAGTYLGAYTSVTTGRTGAVSAGTPTGAITGTGSETRPQNVAVIFITKAG